MDSCNCDKDLCIEVRYGANRPRLFPIGQAWTLGYRPGEKQQAENPRVSPSPAIHFPWDVKRFVSSHWPQLSLLKNKVTQTCEKEKHMTSTNSCRDEGIKQKTVMLFSLKTESEEHLICVCMQVCVHVHKRASVQTCHLRGDQSSVWPRVTSPVSFLLPHRTCIENWTSSKCC